MLRKLEPKYLSIAKGDELARGIANYKEKWVFPVCAGAIDDTYQFQHHSKKVSDISSCCYVRRDPTIDKRHQ